MNPLISVIVPIYKVEQYLRKCVDSILAQTYTNLEVILVDDGSPDNCGVICDEYAAKDARVKVIHKPNGGPSDARNAGMAVMRGQYVAFVDSDDWIEPQHIQSLYELIEGTDRTVAVCDVKRVDESGRQITVFKKNEVPHCVMEATFGYVWNKLYPAALIRGEPFLPVKYAEDMLYNMRIFKKNPQYMHSKRATYVYLLRGNSLLTREISQSSLSDFIVFAENFWCQLCEVFEGNEQRREVYNYWIGNHMCGFLCELSLCDSMPSTEKIRLAKYLMDSVYLDRIKWKYADNNLLRLAVIAKKTHCPRLYLGVYKGLMKWRS